MLTNREAALFASPQAVADKKSIFASSAPQASILTRRDVVEVRGPTIIKLKLTKNYNWRVICNKGVDN